MFEGWKEVVTDTYGTFKSMKKKAGLDGAIINIILSTAVAWGFWWLLIAAGSVVFTGLMGFFIAMLAGLYMLLLIEFPIIWEFISIGWQHLVSTVLGGKGSFSDYAYYSSLARAPMKIISIVVSLVALGIGSLLFLISPSVGFIGVGLAVLVMLGTMVYEIVLQVRALKFSYGLSTLKSVFVMFSFHILFGGIVLFFFLVFAGPLLPSILPGTIGPAFL